MPAYFGGRYFGGRYFGGRYFGNGGGSSTAESTAYAGNITMYPGGLGVLHIGSTNVIAVTGLQDMLIGNFPVTATVTMTLKDVNNNPISGAINLPLNYVAGTSGDSTTYRGPIKHTVTATLTNAATYTVWITAVDPSGNVRLFQVPSIARPG